MKNKKDKAVQAILASAREVFAEAGFSGARVDEIARRAGVNKAMIYYRIGDKATLYGEVLHQVFFGIYERLAQNLEEERSPEGELHAYLHTFSRTFEEHPHLAPIMMRELASGGKDLPDVVLVDLGRILGTLMGILEDGAQRGLFAEANPTIVHLMIIGPMFMRKSMDAIVSRRKQHSDILRHLDKDEPLDIAAEVERLLLKALRR
ncbi:MAG: TetR/AcrR family transcriptional regulator [Desulfatiglandales bacterium]